MRVTEARYADYLKRRGVPGQPNLMDVSDPPFMPKPNLARFALGRMPTGQMNKTEAAYAAHLDYEKLAGTIKWYRFEGLKFRLADNTFYTPDFAVMKADGQIECHEVKGFWQDDARVKIKVASSLFPFRFVAIKARAKKHGGGWEVEEF